MSLLLRAAAFSRPIPFSSARACNPGHLYRAGRGQWRTVTSLAKLEEADPLMYKLLQQERRRQRTHLNLIASENFMEPAVLEALGSDIQNKSSEGYPGKRYHSGCANIDEVERLCLARALEAFKLRPEEWGVNVQPMCGSNANLYVYSALLKVKDTIMGLDMASGGHLSHGYRRGEKNIAMVSKFFDTQSYYSDPKTGLIDYDWLEARAEQCRPKIIIAGASAYSRLIEYERMRQTADKVEAYLMSDMSHIAGPVSAGLIPSPFEYSDIVTCSTAKTLRGPRGGMIFYKRQLGEVIDASVFPGHQSSPHNNTTAALAVALHLACSPEFIEYQKMVLLNAKALSNALIGLGYKLVSGGTDNHLMLIDLRPLGIDGARLEIVLELLGVASNRNMLSTDTSALVPSGLRIGSPAMTSRGLGPRDFTIIAGYLHRAVILTKELSAMAKENEANSLTSFRKFVQEKKNLDLMEGLRGEILAWVARFGR